MVDAFSRKKITLSVPMTSEITRYVSPQRLKHMQKGAKLLEARLENLFEKGVTGLERHPEILTHLAGSMTDYKLNGLSRLWKLAAQQIGNTPTWPSDILDLLVKTQHSLRSLQVWTHLTLDQQLDLLIFCGLTIRKDQLKSQPNSEKFQLHFHLGTTESKEDRLTMRKSYFLDPSGDVSTEIEYIFGQAKKKPMPSGVYYEIQKLYYPGSIANRIRIEGLKRSMKRFDPGSVGVESVTDLVTSIRQNVMKNPWIPALSFWFQDAGFQKIKTEYHLVDKHGQSVRVILSDRWFRRLELASLESPVHLLIEWQEGDLVVISAHAYDQLFIVE